MRKSIFLLFLVLLTACSVPGGSSSARKASINLEDLVGRVYAGRLYLGASGEVVYTAAKFEKQGDKVVFVRAKEKVNAAVGGGIYHGYSSIQEAINSLSSGYSKALPATPVSPNSAELSGLVLGSDKAKAYVELNDDMTTCDYFTENLTTGVFFKSATLTLH